MKDLSDFFNLVSVEKKRQKEEINSFLGEDFFDKNIVDYLMESSSLKKNSNNSKNNKVNNDKNDVICEEVILANENSLGLLAEPQNTKNSDSITPLNQNYATLEDLNKHYNLFLSRIQQQLSTLGGGGESNLTYMDVPTTSVTASSYNIKLQDYYIGVNYAGAVTITLPKSDREGKIFVVKDELGEASKGTNRYITILPTGNDLIDGRDRAILAYDYGSLTFIWKGNSWRVV